MSRSLRRLAVMSGIAAANHRLDRQAEIIRQALALLVFDEANRIKCDAVMQIMLDGPSLAAHDCDPLLTIASRLGQQPQEASKS